LCKKTDLLELAIKLPIGSRLEKPKVVENLGQPGKISVPIKDVWVYPLDKKFRFLLKN
jgi:hypothetical protein